MSKPLIAISGNILTMDSGKLKALPRDYVNRDYSKSVSEAGGIPIIIPVLSGIEDIGKIADSMDGLLLSGGYDVSPDLYGEEPHSGIGFSMREVDLFYISIIKAFYSRRKPILGICKGCQAINVAFGGSLWQDIGEAGNVLKHDQEAPREDATHSVRISKESRLYRLFGETVRVNSFHHQAVKDIPSGLIESAWAPDGIIEAVEMQESYVLGVQWHPEMMVANGNNTFLSLFEDFVSCC